VEKEENSREGKKKRGRPGGEEYYQLFSSLTISLRFRRRDQSQEEDVGKEKEKVERGRENQDESAQAIHSKSLPHSPRCDQFQTSSRGEEEKTLEKKGEKGGR